MKNLLRRLRGLIGTGLTWALGWAGVRAGLFVLSGVPLHFLGAIAFSTFFQGFVAGSAFAVVFSLAERRHTLADLAPPRVALWGAIGGMAMGLLALPALLPLGIPVSALLASFATDVLMGASFATGSVALAKRGEAKLLEEEGEPPLALEGE